MSQGSQTPRAAVIGARGFIGRALVAELTRREIPVTALGRGDLAGAGVWDEVVEAHTIFWAASSINPAIAAEDPSRIEVDRSAARDFLTRLASLGSRARVVYFSSGGTVYGSGTPPFAETAPTRTTSAYGLAKLGMERDVRAWWPDTVVARISNAYGPYQRPAPGQGVIGHWLRAAANGEPIRVFGNLDTVRDYVYVGDLVAALLALHQTRSTLPEVLNIGSGAPTTLRDVLDTVCEVTATHEPQVHIEGSRSFDLDETWLDVTLAREVLGWEPRTSLRDGTRAMWEWVRDHEAVAGGSSS